MRSGHTLSSRLLIGICVCGVGLVAGCANPAAISPPSLKLPKQVADLSAERVGDVVTLRWTMPTETTDRLALREPLDVELCRNSGTAAAGATSCDSTLKMMQSPSATVVTTDALVAGLDAGPERLLEYRVVVKNAKGHSAGSSNAAYVLAGAGLPPPQGLSAVASKRGVLLNWSPLAGRPAPTELLVRRELVDSPASHQGAAMSATSGSVAASPAVGRGSRPSAAEPAMQTLRVPLNPPASNRALDATARFGSTYRYALQGAATRTFDGHSASMASAPSIAVNITPLDKFPPAAPRGLAVALDSASEQGAPTLSVDLSWEPNTEADLAGYIVYRRTYAADGTKEPPLRINPANLMPAPAFQDDHVQPGTRYFYSISAVDKSGNESARSAEEEQDTPAP